MTFTAHVIFLIFFPYDHTL